VFLGGKRKIVKEARRGGRTKGNNFIKKSGNTALVLGREEGGQRAGRPCGGKRNWRSEERKKRKVKTCLWSGGRHGKRKTSYSHRAKGVATTFGE